MGKIDQYDRIYPLSKGYMMCQLKFCPCNLTMIENNEAVFLGLSIQIDCILSGITLCVGLVRR